ncbi:MAG: AAA family ATPase [Arenicellales bacterium]|jgi:MoxR-like ATPase|nr:AAA family ATPase [Gammaproteobacteria bacterium]NDA13632.1 AAA family ATPase [Gammaproteobacteria bacterium]NDG43207.1 AAA family ATPase [Gammaproteobacteria bacterium]
MRPIHLLRILKTEIESLNAGNHTPVMLWGPPGVGKSQLVAQVAREGALPLIDIRLSQLEPSDLRGIPFRIDDRVEWATPAMLPDESKHGRQGVLFLDEITSAAPSVSAAAYQLILDRRLGEYVVPAGWAIVAAGNRQGDRGVTYSMPAPLANRFSHFEVDAHLDDWVLWAYREGIDHCVIGFLRFRPELLFDFDPTLNPIAFPSPRSWEFAHRALQKFSNQPEMLSGALQACVGPAAGVELHAFARHLDQLPDIDAILEGHQAAVPEDLDLQYAVAAALVGRASKMAEQPDAVSRYSHILRYAGLFPQKEMGVMLVADLHRAVGSDMFAAEGFPEWAHHVADVLLAPD